MASLFFNEVVEVVEAIPHLYSIDRDEGSGAADKL